MYRKILSSLLTWCRWLIKDFVKRSCGEILSLYRFTEGQFGDSNRQDNVQCRYPSPSGYVTTNQSTPNLIIAWVLPFAKYLLDMNLHSDRETRGWLRCQTSQFFDAVTNQMTLKWTPGNGTSYVIMFYGISRRWASSDRPEGEQQLDYVNWWRTWATTSCYYVLAESDVSYASQWVSMDYLLLPPR